jgi:hypothetical protein
MKLFKSLVVIAGTALLALSSPPLTASQAKNLDFKLVNKTGLTIESVFLSDSKTTKWGEDVMGRDVLDDNESVDITFSSRETECLWDLKIVDEDKDDVIWTKLDLCKAEEITLMYKDHKPTAVIK